MLQINTEFSLQVQHLFGRGDACSRHPNCDWGHSVSRELLRTCCWEERRGITQMLKGRVAKVGRRKDMAMQVLKV